MKMIFKVMIFSIIINFATGVMQAAVPAFSESSVYRGGLTYNESYFSNFEALSDQSINPPAVSGSSLGTDESRLWDRTILGTILNFRETISQYMFGFVDMLENIFSSMMEDNDTLRGIIFGTIRSLMVMGYILGLFWLFTNKSFVGK